MRRKAILTLMFVCVVAAAAWLLPASGPKAQAKANECSPVGTWYGGAGAAYLFVITPAPTQGDPFGFKHFTAFYDAAYTARAAGNAAMTVVSGPLVKKGDVYEGTAMSLVNQEDAVPGRVASVVIRYRATLDGCNTINSTIDFFGLYFWGDGKVPFKDPPDVNLLDVLAGGQPIHETYTRVTTDCPACPATP